MDEVSMRSPLAGMRLPASEQVASVTAGAPTFRYVLRGDVEVMRGFLSGLSLPLPERINTATRLDKRAVLMLGPDECWVLSPDWLAPSEGLDFGGHALGVHSLVDVSHRNVGMVVTGPMVEDVFAAGCPLPLSLKAFPVGRSTRTLFAKIEIVLWRQGERAFHVECGASLVPYLVGLLATAIAEEEALLACRAAGEVG